MTSGPGSRWPVTGAFDKRVRLLRQMAGRAAGGPMLVRGLLFAAALVALGLAVPSEWLLGRGSPAVLGGAVLVALAPRGRLVSVMLLAAATSWLVSTIAFDDHVVAWRLVALAGSMYLVHTLAALAAVLPYDAVIPPGVVAGWLLRAVLVVVVSAGLGIVSLAQVHVFGGRVYLVASVAGVAVVGLLALVITRSARR